MGGPSHAILDNGGATEGHEAPSGMSRAAKKRAKKKNKQATLDSSCTTKRLPDDEREGSATRTSNTNDAEPQRSKKSKRTREDNDAVVDHQEESKEIESAHACNITGDSAMPPPDILNLTSLLVTNESPNPDVEAMTTKQRANCILNFLLHPAMTTTEFYEQYWEKKPLLIHDKSSTFRHRLDGLLSLDRIKELIQQHPLYFGRDLNVVAYEQDSTGIPRRITLDPQKPKKSKQPAKKHQNAEPDDSDSPNPEEHFARVESKELWGKYYGEGPGACTIRLLCPHQHVDSIHALLSALEWEWGCMVGANAYLTPPNESQGFAPHYDDIEAFVLQLEGQKRWKVYAPLRETEQLPRVSSRDYLPSDLKGVKPVLDVILSPGDVLYMPRGWIHQACTLPSRQSDLVTASSNYGHRHSLHLTISAMQQWAWIDFLELLLPEALQSVAESSSTILREGLPRNFLEYVGVMHDNSQDKLPDVLKKKVDEDEEDPELRQQLIQRQTLREEFRIQVKRRIYKVVQEATRMVDSVCDQMAKRFCSDRLPPAGLKRIDDEGSSLQLTPNMLCRLARPGIARLVLEDNQAVLYHCLDNSRVYHETPLSPLEFDWDDAPALEQLVTTIEPRWIAIEDLFHDTLDDKVGVAQALYDEGLLTIRT